MRVADEDAILGPLHTLGTLSVARRLCCAPKSASMILRRDPPLFWVGTQKQEVGPRRLLPRRAEPPMTQEAKSASVIEDHAR
jgi:hypothetical protein